jgi:hypothetical protein
MADILPAIDPRHTALLVMDFQAGALGVISQPGDIVVRKTHVGAFPPLTSTFNCGTATSPP